MKFIPIILSVILASSLSGYGMHASAQNPCTASQPCTQICGNHVCAPGEVPTSIMPASNASSTKAMPQSTNSTGAPSMAEQMGVSTNATATMHHHGNMTGYMTNGAMPGNMTNGYMHGNMTMGMHMHHHGNMTGNMANGTMTMGSMGSMPATSTLPSPNAQVTAGTPSTSVKCMSGFSLVINNENSRPACVTQSTMSLLLARGWGHAAP